MLYTKSHIYFKNDEICHCGGEYNENTEVPLETCDMECDDGINNCGGRDAFSVYLGWLACLRNYKISA